VFTASSEKHSSTNFTLAIQDIKSVKQPPVVKRMKVFVVKSTADKKFRFHKVENHKETFTKIYNLFLNKSEAGQDELAQIATGKNVEVENEEEDEFENTILES
jgi:hypothetical protein